MRTNSAAYLVVMLMGLSPARANAQPTGAVVRGIQIVEDGGITRVTIDADGPLPLPMSESLENPPRIFLDLAGVTHKVPGTTVAQSGGVVTRVRVALNSASPRVTRVVLDLTRLESYRVDIDAGRPGRIRVVVGSESAINPEPTVPSPAAPVSAPPPSTPVAPAPSAGTPAPPMPAGNSTPAMVEGSGAAAPKPSPAITKPAQGRSPVLSPEEPRPALPVREVEAYRKQIFGALTRMEALRALVGRIDAGENVGSDTLALASQEFTALRRMLETVQPSDVLTATHDLLMTSCTFGAMASRLGIDAAQGSSPDVRQRAASAAAGSLMLFDRACADLGCGKAPR